jgi:hypothetical protein
MSRAPGLAWPVASSVWALVVAAVALAQVDSPLRPALLLSFLLVGPGLALVRLLHLGDLLAELTLACALGVVLTTFVSAGLAYSGYWVPGVGLALLICMTLAANSVEALRITTARRAASEAQR